MNRGGLLLQGVNEPGPGGYTYARQAASLSLWLLLALLAFLGAYFSWNVSMAGSVALNRFFKASITLMPLIVLLMFVPLEIDAIWEKGVSGRRTMFHRLMGRTFLPYEGISVVQVDKMTWGPRRWNRVTLKDQGNKVLLRFGDRGYSNGFYQKLFDVLGRRCPNARWIERSVWVDKWEREVPRAPPSS